jgi:hypothetical protein
MKNPIEFVSAKDGKLEMVLRDGTELPLTDDVNLIALAVGSHGLEGYLTSSMDFADQYGFARPRGARDLLERAMAIHADVARGEFA